MTPGALAVRERVRPPSMTRVVASLAELGLVARTAHPVDGRQVLVSVSDAGVNWWSPKSAPARKWLRRRLAQLNHDERATLLRGRGSECRPSSMKARDYQRHRR